MQKESYQEKEYSEKGAYHWKNLKSRGKELWRYNLILEKCKLKNPEKILDIGCGDLFFTWMLSNNFEKTYGIDFSNNAIQEGIKKVSKNETKGNLYLNIGDCSSLPFKKDSFDLITCVETIEHLDLNKSQQTIKEVYRILKKGGTFMGSVPSIAIPLSQKHYRHFNQKILKEELKNFSELKLESFLRYPLPREINLMSRLFRRSEIFFNLMIEYYNLIYKKSNIDSSVSIIFTAKK
jgi:ubiquinone/menaquinone biosynthesis C-methylase UbiE